MKRLPVNLLVCSLLMLPGCRRAAHEESTVADQRPRASLAPESSAAPLLDACALLTPEDIQAVLGEPLKETKPSGQAGGSIGVSQCFFTMTVAANSVSLAVYQKSERGREPKQIWEETFHREKKDEAEKEEREEKKSKPSKVEGLGDESFWTGNPIGGALYVLKGNIYLRISVGGEGNQDVKINKCRAFAEAALKRLP